MELPAYTKVTKSENLDEKDLNFDVTAARCERVKDLVVEDPHMFISFGIYLPINKFPSLEVFKKETLSTQLKNQVQKVLSKQMGASPHNFFVMMPKNLKWYIVDF